MTPSTASKGLRLPPLPVLSPTALTGDAGDGRAYLRWNLQLEDERVVGWKVLQLEPEARTLTPDALTEPQFVARGLANGKAYTFSVSGVLKGGSATPQSNTVTLTPRDVGAAKVQPLERGAKVAVGQFSDVQVGPYGARIVFPDGQELAYDNLRPIDWKTREGEHLLYPRMFGNGLDIGRFDKRGLPLVIPPEGLKRDTIELDGAVWSTSAPGGFEYRDLQHGTRHPHITDPLTLPLDREWHDARVRWFAPQIDGNRVTLHYWQPLVLEGYTAWQYVLVWETWWPIERERHGTTYRGLARLVEVQMPEAWRDGYQVMLNNGFGPNGGSRHGVVSYSSGFRRPMHEIVDFSGDKSRQVFFQHPKPPRRGTYHPNQDCLQASPLIFYDWGKGSLTLAARGLYYHCSNNSISYPEQGADGVWPSLAWDMAVAGKRAAVDTVEYLFAADTSQPLPQRYMNARFEALGDVSRRMGVQDDVPCAAVHGTHFSVQHDGGPLAHAEKQLAQYRESGLDGFFIFHDFWNSVPATVDDAYRLDESHDCNLSIKAMCDRFHQGGVRVGFWYRPEVVKTSIASALSETIPTADAYYGYASAKYPDVVALLGRRGIPVVRENPDWIRRQRDGSWPVHTHYQWVPMSMASGWWDRVMWPTIRMSAKLGFDWMLMDGGFGGLQGVDYAPMLAGKAKGAVACQPYWWRLFRTIQHVGMRLFGECTVGWKGGFVNLAGPGDEHFIWMYQASCIWGNNELSSPESLHKLFQLYSGSGGDRMARKEVAPVCRYASRLFRAHRPPDWIELKDLRQGEPREVTLDVAESPVAGGPTRVTKENKLTFTVRPWTWTDAVWHYNDGSQIVYAAYEKIDWTKE